MQCLLAVFFMPGLLFRSPVPKANASVTKTAVTKTAVSKASAYESAAQETKASDVDADVAWKESEIGCERWGHDLAINDDKIRYEGRIQVMGRYRVVRHLRQVFLFSIKSSSVVAVGADTFRIQSFDDFEFGILPGNRSFLDDCRGLNGFILRAKFIGSAKRAKIASGKYRGCEQ